MERVRDVVQQAQRVLPFDELAAEAATPGGLNHQALRELDKHKAFDPFLDVLDTLLQRLGLEAPPR